MADEPERSATSRPWLASESADSAQDGHLADSFAIERTVDGDDDGATELPPVPSPPRRPLSLVKDAPERAELTDDLLGPASRTGPIPRLPSARPVPPPAGAPAPVAPAPEEPQPQSRRRRRAARKAARKKAPWWELPVLIAVAILVAVLIKTFVVQPFYIPSESMEKTLHGCAGCSGDRVLVNKPIFDVRLPHPGDIVVFQAPSDNWDDEPLPATPTNPIAKGLRWFGQLVGVVPPDEKDLIKRVIAVGGQTVQCCDSQGRVQVADSPQGPFRSLNEPYIYRDRPDNWTPKDKPNGSVMANSDTRTFGPVTIPANRLWVMGDHRNDSADSVYHWRATPGSISDATVPVDKVIGKAVVIAWPPSRWRTLGTPATFTAAGALGSAAPLTGGMLTVPPLWWYRRRRRAS